MSLPNQDRPTHRRLSVALIVRDAADVLATTLQSIRAIADEIIVVDTGSADDTRLIAAQYATRLLGSSWDHDFSDARNYAWEYVTGDWVLWLDAGERLDAEAAEGLRKFIDQQADATKAYMLLVEVPPADGQISGQQAGRIRLVPNYSTLRFEGRVREQLLPSLAANGLAVEGLPWRIVRGSHEHSDKLKLARARRDLHLAELETQERGEHPRLLVAIGESLAAMGQFVEAAAAFRKALDTCAAGSTDMLEAYYGLLASCDSNPELREKQMVWCLEALEVFPFDAQLLCAMGSYLQAQGQLELAGRAYRTAVDYGKIDPQTWHLSNVREVVACCLSVLLQLEGKDDEALQVLEQAAQAEGATYRVRRQIVDLHIKHDRRQAALEHSNLLPCEIEMRESLRTAVRGACLAAKRNWLAAQAYLHAAYKSGCRDPICLRWYAVTLLSTGEVGTAEPILHQWLQREPRNLEARRYLENLTAGQTGLAAADEPADRHGMRLRLDTAQVFGAGILPSHAGLPMTQVPTEAS